MIRGWIINASLCVWTLAHGSTAKNNGSFLRSPSNITAVANGSAATYSNTSHEVSWNDTSRIQNGTENRTMLSSHKTESYRNTTGSHNGQEKEEEDGQPFTIIFLSDLETKFRGHTIDRSRYVVNYVASLKEQELFFDGPYQDQPIDPQLVIHGGDISHFWSCFEFHLLHVGRCRTPADEFRDVWDRLYKNGNDDDDDNKNPMPMISSLGNHDWYPSPGTGNQWSTRLRQRTNIADTINRQSSEFVKETYVRTAEIIRNQGGDNKFEYEEVKPTGEFGQSMYRANFRGLQIASFNAAFNWESYDDRGVYSAEDQLERFSNVLDRSKKTLFFSHWPLSKRRLRIQKPSLKEVTTLIGEFGEGSHHFSGHYHAEMVEEYPRASSDSTSGMDGTFRDYVAAYPHAWAGRDPAFLAILASKKDGILQVKSITIPGLDDGEVCIPVNYLTLRNNLYMFDGMAHQTNFENVPNGCDKCKTGRHTLSLFGGFTCGGWLPDEED